MAKELDSCCIVRALGERQFVDRLGSPVSGGTRQQQLVDRTIVLERVEIVDGSPFAKGTKINLISTSAGTQHAKAINGMIFSSGQGALQAVPPLQAGKSYFILAMKVREGKLLQPTLLQDLRASERSSDRFVLPSKIDNAPYVVAGSGPELSLLNAFPTGTDSLVNADSQSERLFENLLECLKGSDGPDLIQLTKFMSGYRLRYAIGNPTVPDDAWSVRLKALAQARQDPFFRMHLYKLLVSWSKPDVVGPFVNALMDLGDDPTALIDKVDPKNRSYDLEEDMPHGILEGLAPSPTKGPMFDAARANRLAVTASNPGVRHYLQEECLAPMAESEMPALVALIERESPEAQEALLWRLSAWTKSPGLAPRDEISRTGLHRLANRGQLISYWKKRFPAKSANP